MFDFLNLDLNAMFAGMSGAMNQQMAGVERQVVAQAMNDPRCAAMYRDHRMQGGMLTPEQFAYQYAATGGFTPQGMANYRSSEAANQAGERAAWQGLQQAQAARGAAQAEHSAHFSANQQEAGRSLMGQTTWIEPTYGISAALPQTMPPSSVYQDPHSGRTFGTDASGNMFLWDQGWWRPMHQKPAGS